MVVKIYYQTRILEKYKEHTPKLSKLQHHSVFLENLVKFENWNYAELGET